MNKHELYSNQQYREKIGQQLRERREKAGVSPKNAAKRVTAYNTLLYKVDADGLIALEAGLITHDKLIWSVGEPTANDIENSNMRQYVSLLEAYLTWIAAYETLLESVNNGETKRELVKDLILS